MSNPLSEHHRLPPFSAIKPEHVKPAIEQRLNANRERVRELLASVTEPTWDNPLWRPCSSGTTS